MNSSRSAALSVPVLKRDEEATLIEAWKAGRKDDAFRRICEAYMRLCFKIARYYSSNPAHLEDLAQEGVFGIRRALDDFDPSYGTRFSTFVRRYVQNAIADKVAATVYDVTIPSRILLDVRAGRVSPEKAPRAHAAAAPRVSLDAVSDDGAPAPLIRDTSPDPYEALEEKDTNARYGKLVGAALSGLLPRERSIVERRHLSAAPDTLEQIGDDLGLTRERVRQLEAKALQRMRRLVAATVGRRGPFT